MKFRAFLLGLLPLSAFAAPYSGTVLVQQLGPGNEPSDISMSFSEGTTQGVELVLATSNRGDYLLKFLELSETREGAMISTSARNAQDNTAGGEPAGSRYSVNAVARYGPTVWGIAVHQLLSNEEYNTDSAFALFPYDEYLGGVTVNLNAVLGTEGVEFGSGKEVDRVGTGLMHVDLRKFGATPDTGILLTVSAVNNDMYSLVEPDSAAGIFRVRARDSDEDASDPLRDTNISFVFLPFEDVGKAGKSIAAAGRIRSDGTAAKGAGTFTIAKGSEGQWALSIPGHNPSTGTLLVTPVWGGNLSVDNLYSYEWNEEHFCYDIEGLDLPNPYLQDGGDPSELMFNFAFVTNRELGWEGPTTLIDDPFYREIRPHGDSVIGNGIDMATGSFQQALELLGVDGIRPLTFDIFYDSRLTRHAGQMGYGWSHNYQAKLIPGKDRGVIIQWDAHRYSRFKYREELIDGTHFYSEDEDVQYAWLTEQVPHPALPPGKWRLGLQDGTVYYFYGDGRLAGVRNTIGQIIETRYDNEGRLDELVEPYSGLKLMLGYNDRSLIDTVTDELGRVVKLDYDDRSRIVTVRSPQLAEEEVRGDDFTPVTITDNTAGGAEAHIDVLDGGAISGVVARMIHLSHARPADLTITLVSPAGTELSIPAVATEGVTTIKYTDEFFEAFEGEDRMGRWTLNALDGMAGATGTIQEFKLSFVDSTRAVHYTYNDNNQIVAATDSLGEPLFGAAYDAFGRIVRQSDGRADTPDATVRYSGDPDEAEVESVYVDPLGEEWTFLHDANFHLLRATDPLGQTVSFTYSEKGDRISYTDPKRRETRFTYSEYGSLSSVTDTGGYTTFFNHDATNHLLEITDAFDRKTSMLYDSYNRLTKVIDELGNADKREFHSSGQISKVISADGDELKFAVDEKGRMKSVTHPEYTENQGLLNYDVVGRLIRTTDMGGNETITTYTAASEVRKRVDPLGNVSRWDYDHRGRLVRFIDERGFSTTYQHDGNGNIVSATNAIGEKTTYEYDADDRLVATIDPRGAKTMTHYDALGRVVGQTDALGRTTQTLYDAVGNVVGSVDAEGKRVMTVVYDERDLPVRIEDSLGHVVKSEYDAMMRRTKVTDELGRETLYEYDELDRMTKVTDPLGRVASTEYNSDDTVYFLRAPGQERVAALYDASKVLYSLTLGDGREDYFDFDPRGLLVRTDAIDGRGMSFQYDDEGRITVATPGDTFGYKGDLIRHYEYDEAGNMTRIGSTNQLDDPFQKTIERSFDPIGRIATYTNEENETLIYIYDQSGNLGSLIYPDGSELKYTYDLANRLVKVEDWADRITTFEWDVRDRMTRIDFPNQTYRKIEYDDAGNVRLRQDYAADGSVIVSYYYSYDAAGQLQSELVEPAEEPALPEEVTYDFGFYPGIYSDDGEYLGGQDPETLAQLYDYNVRGKLYLTANYNYDYDAEDRLVGWSPVEGTDGDRVKFCVNPSAGLSQILTAKGTNADLKRYIYGIGLLYEENAATGDIRVFHYDHRGSAVAFSGKDGNVIGRVSYAPYGQITNRTGDTDTMFLFNGLFGVPTSPEELVNMRYRWYSPKVRSFLSRDAHIGALDSIGSRNRRAFAGLNPAMNVDPQGEFWWVAAGAAIGGIVNTGITFVADLANDGQINTGAEEYLASFVSGAVSGGIIAATGGVGGAIVAGGLGAATENLMLAGLRGEQVDLNALATESLVGAATGAVGFGAGKVGGKVTGKLYNKTFGKPGRFAKAVNTLTTPDKVARRRAVGSMSELIVRSGRKEASDALKKVLLRSSGPIAQSVYRRFRADSLPTSNLGSQEKQNGSLGDFAIILEANQELNAGRLGQYGEYIHYDIYLDAVRLADKPVPAHPNNTLAGF